MEGGIMQAGFVQSVGGVSESVSTNQNNDQSYYHYPETKVKVELSFTRNLGNYESIKINIGVEDFVRPGENANTATERVYEFVESKLIEKTREVEAEIKNGK
jgi:hypothetical protein